VSIIVEEVVVARHLGVLSILRKCRGAAGYVKVDVMFGVGSSLFEVEV
jgi:hypothetical protein